MWSFALFGLASASKMGDLIEILEEISDVVREEHRVPEQEPLEAVKQFEPAREFIEKLPVSRANKQARTQARPTTYRCVDDKYYTEETGSQPMTDAAGNKNLDFWVTIWGMEKQSEYWSNCQACGREFQEKGIICGGWSCEWYWGTIGLYRDGRPCPSCAPHPDNVVLTGRWTKKGSSNGAQEFSITEGTTRSMSTTEAQTWANSVTQSAQAGIEVEGIGVSRSIEASTSYSLALSHTSSFQKTKTETWKWSAPAGVVWQWEFDVNDNCGKATVQTADVIVTNNVSNPPKCLPGYFVDPTQATGSCTSDAAKLY